MSQKRAKKKKSAKSVETIKHSEDKRVNIPTAEMNAVMDAGQKYGHKVRYPRNTDLDPQLVWRGKDEQDWSDLVVDAPPLYIQEKVHPKVLIDDLLKQTNEQEQKDSVAEEELQLDMFSDFNGLPEEAYSTEFYEHEANWTNRMILGDSLQVMASLAEREGLRGKVQCIYIDPPYGIKFNSNFQWSTTSRDVKDGRSDHMTREPEQVKAFRDTWRDGIHSYLTYLRDRLTVARDLLSESGSIFVQIGDENRHRVRALLDETFGEDNFVASIEFTKSSSGLQSSSRVACISDSILWFVKSADKAKFRRLLEYKGEGLDTQYTSYLQDDGTFRSLTKDEKRTYPNGIELDRVIQPDNLTKPGPGAKYEVLFRGKTFTSGKRWWGTPEESMQRLLRAGRVVVSGSTLRYARRFVDSRFGQLTNLWTGFLGQTNPTYVVQTNTDIVQRCILMVTDPGDLVLDPTCGSGTTAVVSEEWGRRWIMIDTSRVALALARSRIMGVRYDFFYLADSTDGKLQEAKVTRTSPTESTTTNNIRHGFVYGRVPQITPSVVSNNIEIDVIWEKFQEKLESIRDDLNKSAEQHWEEWEIPREAEKDWSDKTQKLQADWWKLRIERQKEIDASIAAKADFEYLYDRPYEDKSKVRVAGPFTVESLSPHRSIGVDENDELIDPLKQIHGEAGEETDFATMVLDNLKKAGVQQSSKEDKIDFTSISLWPGRYICAEGRYTEGENDNPSEIRAGIFIGPEFGTVSREDLVGASRECGEAGFDVLISCAFNYEAHASEFSKLGKVQVLKARMNADLHMADELANTGKGNLFVVFGEPDIDILDAENDRVQVKINGVDIFHPNSGEITSDDTDGIACWFVDTDYNEESFFVRHAYFLGAGDPYKSLKTTLKAEINQEAWETLYSDTSRPFKKPRSGRIAVKVINHLGDEVMKVFKVD